MHASRGGWTRSPARWSSAGRRIRGRRLAPSLGEALPQPVDDVLKGGSRREELGHALLLQGGDVVLGDDAAAEHDDVSGLASFQFLNDRWKQSHVGAGVD